MSSEYLPTRSAEDTSTIPGKDITPEAIVDLLVPQAVSLSPNGDLVLYSATSKGRKGRNPTSSIWIAETNTPNSARQLTSGLFNDCNPQWHPSEDIAVFVSDRHKPGESCAIYLQHMRAGDPVSLTDVKAKKNINALAWSPDGKYIAYTSPDEKSPEQEAKEKEGDDAFIHGQHWEYSRLRVLHVESRKVKVVEKKDMHVYGFAWSADSKRLVSVSKPDTIFDTPVNPRGDGVRWDVDSVGGEQCEHITNFAGTIIAGFFGGGSLVWGELGVEFVAPVNPMSCASAWAVYRLDIEQKKFDVIAYGEKNDIRKVVGGKDWSASDVYEGLEDQVRLVGGETLYAGTEELTAFDVVKKLDGSFAAVVVTNSVSAPSEVYTVDVSTKKKKHKLSCHGGSIADAKIGTAHPIICKSYDNNYDLQAFYFTPGDSTSKPSKPLPTAVFVHGGPYWRGNDSFSVPYFPWSPYVLASGAYGILAPNYRGGNSLGETHARAVSLKAGTGEHDDVLALVDEGIAQGFIDPERVLIGGWSYGGLLSFIAAVRNGRTTDLKPVSWKYKAAIPGAGVSDQEQMAVGSDHIYYSSETAGGNPWSVDWRTETSGRKGSAIWQMKEGRENLPPCLILHGDADDRVPISQAWGFQRGLNSYGVKNTLVTYPREGHIIEERAHMVDMLKRVRAFCDEHIGAGL